MKNTTISPLQVGLAFFAIYFIWGTTYIAILFGLDGVGPFAISTFRYGAAAILLSIWCVIKNKAWPKTQRKTIVLSGVLMLVGGSGLVVYGEKFISSGLAAVIIATEPIWFVLLDKKRWGFYFSNWKIIIGLVLGFVGIVLFTAATPGAATGTQSQLVIGSLIVLAGSITWVIGALYQKNKISSVSTGITNTAMQLAAASIVSFVIALCRGEWKSFHFDEVSMAAWGGIAYLTIMGTLVAYMAFIWLLKVRPPAVVSTHTLINPIIAVFMGWLVLNEFISGVQLFALAITLVGIFLIWIKQTKLKNQ